MTPAGQSGPSDGHERKDVGLNDDRLQRLPHKRSQLPGYRPSGPMFQADHRFADGKIINSQRSSPGKYRGRLSAGRTGLRALGGRTAASAANGFSDHVDHPHAVPAQRFIGFAAASQTGRGHD
jgi:hypothetical protein